MKIKRKMKIKINIAKKIIKRALLRIKINNFFKILICVNNIENKNILFYINDDNQLFKKIRNIIFKYFYKYFYISFEKIVNNKKILHIFDE